MNKKEQLNQAPVRDWVDWDFLSSPEDKETVEILRFGKVEKVQFNKKYSSFNPFSPHGNCYSLGCHLQEGITQWRRL